ncbi:MAG: SDR family oxidoreductase [Armatimonadetes bacterium]|nr:SDR family oxidoreductase [Armatimonadota bacterium]
MGLLDTKSLAWVIGTRAAEAGAEVIYTVQSERFRDTLLRRSFRQEGLSVDDYRILPCDVTRNEEIEALFGQVGMLDGVVHSIAYAKPETCLTGPIWNPPREDVALAFQVSAASLAYVGGAAADRLRAGGSIVTLTFDSQHAYPSYNWMGVCKAALEAVARYLARDLGPRGVRINCVSAGPQRTRAATHIPGFAQIEEEWPARAPLGWDPDTDRQAIAGAALFLLSDLSGRITGEILHVDGGFHVMGVPAERR